MYLAMKGWKSDRKGDGNLSEGNSKFKEASSLGMQSLDRLLCVVFFSSPN